MLKRTIGNTDWHPSAIILGNMRMGDQTVSQAIDVLNICNDTGINMIDSADIYAGGQSETILGKALKQGGFNRDTFFIQSKAGIQLGSKSMATFGKRYNFRKDYILQQVDAILDRLQIEYLDSFLLHRPDPLMEVTEVAEAFDYLYQSGKVRYFGVSNFSDYQIRWLQTNLNQPLYINQLQFGLMHTAMIDYGLNYNGHSQESLQQSGNMLEFALLNNITIQAWSPFQHGMIEGVFIDNPNYPIVNEMLTEIADKYHVDKNAIATAWILKHPAKMQVISGSMNPNRIQMIAKGATVHLTDQEWYDLYIATGNDLP
ncbi:aldo/keto reductase [Aerococcaceae bacterium DSM 111020]|nr:aldo/keto reductase [Aerococcaceae bacterium DSM 111020]